MFSKIISKTCNLSVKGFATSSVINANHSCKLLIVGGGTAGCSLGARFARDLKKNELIILEPSDSHYYQPLFTLVGGGIYKTKDARRDEKDVLPKNSTWIKDKVAKFNPKDNTVMTAKGDTIKYDFLLVAVGIEPNYEKIPGLLEALSIPNGKVCSVYSSKYAERTFTAMSNIESGNAIFTYPNSPVKCPGAPQKICYITEHFLRKMGKRDKVQVTYNTSLGVIFGVKKYADALWKVCKGRNIEVNLRTNLIEVIPDKNEAVFQNLDKPDEKNRVSFSMLHAVPPMSTPESLRNCKELVNEAGFVDVDKATLQHVKFPNVYSLGDCASTPNSKTAAAIAAQNEVVYKNMNCTMKGEPSCREYGGYASCPLVTGYDTCILAEFDYNLAPLETFPFSQDREMRSMYLMKKIAMPAIYWHMMLKGHWSGPAVMRKILHLGFV